MCPDELPQSEAPLPAVMHTDSGGVCVVDESMRVLYTVDTLSELKACVMWRMYGCKCRKCHGCLIGEHVLAFMLD